MNSRAAKKILSPPFRYGLQTGRSFGFVVKEKRLCNYWPCGLFPISWLWWWSNWLLCSLLYFTAGKNNFDMWTAGPSKNLKQHQGWGLLQRYFGEWTKNPQCLATNKKPRHPIFNTSSWALISKTRVVCRSFLYFYEGHSKYLGKYVNATIALLFKALFGNFVRSISY